MPQTKFTRLIKWLEVDNDFGRLSVIVDLLFFFALLTFFLPLLAAFP